MTDARPADRRFARTRGYDALTVSDIVEQANIGRSTFYEHYENKDDLFRQSLRPIVTVLANAILENCDQRRLELVVQHFAERRALVAAIASGTARTVITQYLQEELETRLARTRRKTEHSSAFPIGLIAAQIAAAQWGLLLAWLSSEGVPAERIAIALAASSKAIATAGAASRIR
jgi:AcrR family transcriptional regulator